LTVGASGTIDTPFLFDFIHYIPDANTILDNATMVVDASDPQIGYSASWSTPNTSAVTSLPGSFLNFDFVGAFHL
jgi:hypothetical protein